MRNGVLVLGVIISVLLIPIISAEIFLSQPDDFYNVGDSLNVSVVLSPSVDKSDFFSMELLCGNEIVDIYKSHQKVNAGEEKRIMAITELSNVLVTNITGRSCYISGEYGGEHVNGQSFEITNEINVGVEIYGVAFEPGEKVRISGKATKANGEDLDGFVELGIEGMNLSLYSRAVGGDFELNFSIPGKAKTSDYTVNIMAYERNDNEEITNKGQITEIIRVRGVLKEIKIKLEENLIKPGNEMIYTVGAYDQAGEETNRDVGVVIYTPSKRVFDKGLVRSGNERKLLIESNYSPGYWGIEAKLGELEASKLFYVEELETASFELVNGTLTIIKNTGNVRYQKPIEFSIGGINEIIELDLGIGEEKILQLSAPDGEYNIEISDGVNSEALGRTFLTGNAISVDDIKRAGSGYLIGGWIVIILVLAMIIFYVYLKIWKKRKSPVSKEAKPVSVVPIKSGKKIEENHLIDKGEKQECNVIALKIKNKDDFDTNSSALRTVDRALIRAKGGDAKIYTDDNYRIIIFSKLLTHVKDNNLRAIKVAKEMDTIFDAHNKRSKEKVDFGIGVHVGEMIVEKYKGRFRFTSTMNTIPIAKRIATESKKKALLSPALHRKVAGKVKTKKLANGYWEIIRFLDRAEYENFISNFLHRHKTEKKND